jgi:hypothetical protein
MAVAAKRRPLACPVSLWSFCFQASKAISQGVSVSRLDDGWMRDELLNESLFASLAQAKAVIGV